MTLAGAGARRIVNLVYVRPMLARGLAGFRNRQSGCSHYYLRVQVMSKKKVSKFAGSAKGFCQEAILK